MAYEEDWAYTERVKEEHGELYLGRPLIARDTPISGGVYYAGIDEAIVVDVEAYPDEYLRLYEEAQQRASQGGGIKRNRILEAVYNTVDEAVPYSIAGVRRLLARTALQNGWHEGFPDGGKIELSSFVKGRVGVCRHQAPLGGVLLELFKKDGYVRGDVSVDRNMNWITDGHRGGHAWTRYVSYYGEVFVLDVAQHYFGSLRDAAAKAKWDYLRPEDRV
jgi:hypothetical protein